MEINACVTTSPTKKTLNYLSSILLWTLELLESFGFKSLLNTDSLPGRHVGLLHTESLLIAAPICSCLCLRFPVFLVLLHLILKISGIDHAHTSCGHAHWSADI